MLLVKFGATWCQPCQKFEPVLAELVEEKGYEIHDVDVDELDADTLREWGVSGVPASFVIDDNNEIVKTIRGAVPAATIESALEV